MPLAAAIPANIPATFRRAVGTDQSPCTPDSGKSARSRVSCSSCGQGAVGRGSHAASRAVNFPLPGTRSAQRWYKTASTGTCTQSCRRSSPHLPRSSTNQATRICSVDLNIAKHLAVCTILTVEGTVVATRFIKGGKQLHGLRKRQLGRIARNRRKTGIIAAGEQDNAALWARIRALDEESAQ